MSFQALTVRQPYASLLVRGQKAVENRSRPTALRGRLLIHAAKLLHERFAGTTDEAILRLPTSSIVGAVQLVDCHEAVPGCGCWRIPGRQSGAEWDDRRPGWHWVVEQPREFVTPIPRVRGMLGFWVPDDRTQHLAAMALTELGVRP